MVVQNADCRGNISLLAEQVHTAPGPVREADGQVLLADGLDLVIMIGKLLGIGLAVLRSHDIGIEISQLAVHPDADGNAADDMDIAGTQPLGLDDDFAHGEVLAHDGRAPFCVFFRGPWN